MRRMCLFAGFDPAGKVHDYVTYYISALSALADVHYTMDFNANPSEAENISNYTKSSYFVRHNEYDFGSWKFMINKIGWSTIKKYDQLILTNDSCYGPIVNLAGNFTDNQHAQKSFTDSKQFFSKNALDKQTELVVIEAIDGINGKKTILLIAHRLTILKKCDKICLLPNGKIVKEGTYD